MSEDPFEWTAAGGEQIDQCPSAKACQMNMGMEEEEDRKREGGIDRA